MGEDKDEADLKLIIQKFKDNLSYLYSKKIIIAAIVLVAMFLGALMSIFGEQNYKASVSLVIEEESKSPGGLASIASSIGLGGVGGSSGLFTTTNMLEFFKTRMLFEKTLLEKVEDPRYNNITFAELYLQSAGWRDKWKDKKLKKIQYKVNEDRTKFSLQKDSILGLMYKSMLDGELDVAKPSEENSVIIINIKTKNETFAKRFPEKLIDVVAEFYTKSKTQKQQQNVDILQRQVDSVKTELYSSLTSAAASSDQIFALSPALNTKKTPYARKQIEVQTNTAILTELVKNLEVSKMNLLNQTPFIQVIDNSVYPLDKERLGLIKGIIIGGILGFILIAAFLVVKRYISNL